MAKFARPYLESTVWKNIVAFECNLRRQIELLVRSSKLTYDHRINFIHNSRFFHSRKLFFLFTRPALTCVLERRFKNVLYFFAMKS